jgi:phage tail-like protein
MWFDIAITGVRVATFTGCSGLSATRDVLAWQEGGDNNTVARLAGRLSYTNVVLTRVVDEDSAQLLKWFNDQQKRPDREPVTIRVFHTFGSADKVVATWKLIDAMPVKYTGPMLATGHNGETMAIETLEISHQGFDGGGR